MYGQLLRRMTYGPAEDPVRYAVVVPEEIAPAALRVSREIRERLGIDVYAVSEDASVRQVR
jgi:F420-0:gamma-glutamyl ligase-like protein